MSNKYKRKKRKERKKCHSFIHQMWKENCWRMKNQIQRKRRKKEVFYYKQKKQQENKKIWEEEEGDDDDDEMMNFIRATESYYIKTLWV